MKVLQVTAVDFTVEKFLLPLIDASIANGYDVHTACRTGSAAKRLSDKGYLIHHIPFHRNLNFFGHIANVFRLYKLLKTQRFDVVHTHTPVASIVARLAAKMAGVPSIIYTAHGFYFHENMNPIVYKLIYGLEKFWSKWLTDYLFFQSSEDYELALKDKFNRPDRLLHIGNGVSSQKFNPELYDRTSQRRELGFVEDDIVLMFVGRLVQEKGIIELLEAFTMLKSTGRSRIKLVIVGGSVEGDRDGLQLDQVIGNIPAEIRKDMLFAGLRDDVPSLLSACDVFVLPSYREGLPRSIIEAMGMGKPIVATNIRGCREEVFPERNGYLCRRKDSRDLADKLAMLVDFPEKIAEFGAASRKLFLEEFDESIVLDKQIRVFKRLAKGDVHV